MKNPEYIDHHEGFGMRIRNTYIYEKDLPMLFPVMADDLSAIIFEKVIDRLKNGMDEKGRIRICRIRKKNFRTSFWKAMKKSKKQ